MKYAEEIVKEIEKRSPIDTTSYIVDKDDTWEDYIRGRGDRKMGTMIDEHIKRMGDIRSNYDRWSVLGLTPNEAKAFDVAVSTMRKYQKIEEIVKDTQHLCEYGSAFIDIRKVIEDGNDD